MSATDTKTIQEMNQKILGLSKTIDTLGKIVNKNTKSFEKMSDSIEETNDSFEDQEKKLKFLSEKFEFLKNKIINVNSEYESFADKLMKPLNLAAISGTLGITSAISLAHGEVQKLSNIADSFRSMSNEFGNMGGVMSTMFSGMANSLAGSDTIKSTMGALHNTGLQVNETFSKLTAEIGTLDQITGIAADTWAGFHGELVRSFGATIDDVQQLSSALIGTGIQGAELDKVIGTVKTTIEQVGHAAKDGVKSIKALTQSMGSSIAVFTKMGISAQKAGEFIGSMMNPEDFQKNSLLLANLGISYEDYISSIETAEGKTKMLNKAMENLPQLAERISEIRDPFQRMNLAKNLGVPLEIVSKMAGKTKSEIRDLMALQMKESAEKEALDKKKEQAKANQAKFEDALWLLKMKMLGPVMNWVSNNYGNFFKVLDENAGSVAKAFTAIFGVIQKLIPLLVKVSIFIGQNIAKAFEIVIKPIGKLVDVILKLVFPLIDNIIIPVVEKMARGLEWLADNLTKIIPILVPFVGAIGGLYLLKKAGQYITSFNALITSNTQNIKDSIAALRKGDFKGAFESFKGKEIDKPKVQLEEKNEIIKGITHPIVKAINNGIRALKPSPISNQKPTNEISGFGKKREEQLNRIKAADAIKEQRRLDALNKIKNMSFAEKRAMELAKTGGAAITKVPTPDFSKAGLSIGSSIGTSIASTPASKLITQGITRGILTPFKATMGKLGPMFGKLLNLGKLIPGIGWAIAAIDVGISAVDGFVNAGKFFNKELSSSQEKQLEDFQNRIKNGEILSKEERDQMNSLLAIKKKMMTESEKNELKDLEHKRIYGNLSAKEQLRLEQLRKKDIASQATWGEKIAGGLSGVLSFGILPLIDSFFGTELQKKFANFLLPLGNSISDFFSKFQPLVDATKTIFNEILVQFRWAWARISAFFEVSIINPLKELWNSISNLFGNIVSWFSEINSGITNSIQPFSEWLLKIWSYIKKGTKYLKLLLIPLDFAVSGFQSMILGIKGFIDGMDKMIQKIKNGDILAGIWEGLKGIGSIVLQPLTAMFMKAKSVFTRIGQMFKRFLDSIMLFFLDNDIIKKIGGSLGLDVEGLVSGIKTRQKNWEDTDKWTNAFDTNAEAFWSAQTKAEKASILNKLMNNGDFANLMSANSSLNAEEKTTYRNMIEMMKKQLAEMKETRKEAKQTGGAIVGAIKKDEPPKEIKPEIKLRAFNLSRFVPAL